LALEAPRAGAGKEASGIGRKAAMISSRWQRDTKNLP
jgi:hypothetical protein